MELLQCKIELVESSLLESNILQELQFIHKFKIGEEYDYNSLILSYLLLSDISPGVKTSIIVQLAETSTFTYKYLIYTIIKLSCEVLPNLSQEEAQINTYQMSHYLTTLVIFKSLLEKALISELKVSPLANVNSEFEEKVRGSQMLERFLSSEGVRSLLYQEFSKTRLAKSSNPKGSGR